MTAKGTRRIAFSLAALIAALAGLQSLTSRTGPTSALQPGGDRRQGESSAHFQRRLAKQDRMQHWDQLHRALVSAVEAGYSAEKLRLLAAEAVTSLALEDFPLFVRLAERLAPPECKQALIGALIARWAESHPQAAAECAAALPSVFVSADVIAALYKRLSNTDTKSATLFAGSLSHAHFSESMLADAIARWANADWTGTLDWIAGLPEGRVKECSVKSLLADADAPQLAALAACVQHLSADYAHLQWQLAGAWARHDPARAAAWADTLPAGEAKERALSLALLNWAKEAPFDAAKFTSGLPAGAARDEAAARVVSAWAHQDPSATARWLDTFPDIPLRARSVAELAFAWAQADPIAAANWLMTVPDGGALESGLLAFSRGIAPIYPATAFRWAGLLASPAARQTQLEAVARLWLAVDPQAGWAVVEQSDLPSAVKERLYINAVRPAEIAR